MKKPNLVFLLVVLFGMMTGCTTIKPTPETPLPATFPPKTFSHDLFDQVLQRFVDRNGRVDYAALAGDTRDLDRYYRQLATYSPDSHPQMFPTPAEQLAYWINAYNAATIKTVLNHYPIASVADVRPPLISFFLPDKSGFFLLQRQILGGRKISLYELENGIVRKRYADPRYHFALNCASVGCPRLPTGAFAASNLEVQLEREARRFLSEERNFKIDMDFIRWAETKTPGHKASLLAYLRPYLEEDRQAKLDAVDGSYQIHFSPYDWGLNDVKQKNSGLQG